MTEIEAFVNRNLETSGLHTFEYLIEKYDLARKGRHREFLLMRQYLQYLMRKNLYPFEYIAEKFKQDHATVINSVRKIEGYLGYKDSFLMRIIKDYGSEFQNAK